MTIGFFTAEILRYFIGFFLLAAALSKLRVAKQFQENLVQSFGISASLSAILSPMVIAAEFVIAMMVLALFERGGMLAALLMLSAFTTLLCYKFFTESVVKCSCFGEAERSVSIFDLLRNVLVLVALAIWFVLPIGAALPLHAALLAAALAAILCVLAIEFHAIAAILVQD